MFMESSKIQMNGLCSSPVYLENKNLFPPYQLVGWGRTDWLATKTQMSRIMEYRVFRESVQQKQLDLSLVDTDVLGLMTCYNWPQTDRYVPCLDP